MKSNGTEVTAPELRELADADAIVLLPVASTEQHGPHLATGVDTFLCGEACRRTALLVTAHHPIVVAPTVWMGLAEHHVAFGGTFSLSLCDMARTAARFVPIHSECRFQADLHRQRPWWQHGSACRIDDRSVA